MNALYMFKCGYCMAPSELSIYVFFKPLFFISDPLDYTNHVVQANFLQEKILKRNLWKIHSNCSVQ